jgi:RNA polymerase sigma-70 factor (ECF subfamily)
MVVAIDSKHTLQSSSYWSFEVLYETYNRPIHNYIYHLVEDHEQADDLTQDTFLKVFRALPKLDAHAKISAWIYRIATNTAYDALRRRKIISWLPWEALKSEIADLDSIDPQEICGEIDLIRSALEHMPQGYRTALLLYTNEGFSYKEIARLLNIAETGVKMYLSRARRAFKSHYQKLAQESSLLACTTNEQESRTQWQR